MQYILGQQGGLCSICGNPVDMSLPKAMGDAPQYATWDHVLPVSHGGDRKRNLLVAHKSCNVAKGDIAPSASLLALLKKVYG